MYKSLPLGFATYPPRAIPLSDNTFHKVLGDKLTLKILLYLNSKLAQQKGSSSKGVLSACRIPKSVAVASIRRLKTAGLIAKSRTRGSRSSPNWIVTRKGQRFLAHMIATSQVRDRRSVMLILARCRSTLHQRNRPKSESLIQRMFG